MNKLIAAVALVAATAAAPALAVTYDAFSSFNGVNGNGNFNYGYTDSTTLTSFDLTTPSSSCVLGSGSTCLNSAAVGNLPQASIGGSAGTVNVPTNAILVHPGNSASLSDYVGFVATTAGSYAYTIDLQSVGRDTTNGIGYTPFTSVAGVVTLGTRGTLTTYLASTTLTGTQTLGLGDVFGVIVDYNGVYYGDSTGVNFTVNDVTGTVPEPAMWGLMLGGFGLVGASMRRRNRTAVAA